MRNTWINREDKLFQIIKEVVNKYDPMNLIAIGCTEDEYESEVIDILNRCHYLYDTNELIQRVRDIFEFWFDKSFINDEIISNMAKKIDKIFTDDLFEEWE